MFSFTRRSFWQAAILPLTLALMGLLVASHARPGGPPWGVPSGFPWQEPKIHGYHEPGTQPPPPPAPPSVSPQKYTVQITILPYRPPEANPNVAHIVAHVPANALIWFEGEPTKQTGSLRYFESPALVPGKLYRYTARVAWVENGHWVSQIVAFPVQAGVVHCMYLARSNSPGLEDEIKTNLAKLSPEDRKLAAEQRFCAVQEGVRLGSMGVPVKMMLKRQPVFLCCKGCTNEAKEHPERTLARAARERKARDKQIPPK
jgi:uncharacterized protein (TIGR03000 family)